MDAGGARLLRDAARREVSTSFGATIIRSANSSMTMTMYGSLRRLCRLGGLLLRGLHRRRGVGQILVARRLVVDDAAASPSRLGQRDLGVGVEIDLLLGAVGAGDDDADLLVRLARGLGAPRPRLLVGASILAL